MMSVSNFEYSQGDLLGHGAFALVFKGRRKKVRVEIVTVMLQQGAAEGKDSYAILMCFHGCGWKILPVLHLAGFTLKG